MAQYMPVRLAASIDSSDRIIPLTSTRNLPPQGIIVVDRVDLVGTSTPIKREFIAYNAISHGVGLIGVTRGHVGSTAQSHTVGANVEEILPDWVDIITPEEWKPTLRVFLEVYL